jgi:cytochrome c
MVLRALSAGCVLAFTLAACSGEAPGTEEPIAVQSAEASGPEMAEAVTFNEAVVEEAKAPAAEVAEAPKEPEAPVKPAQAAIVPAAATAPAAAAEIVKVAEASHPASYNRCITCHTANKGGDDKLGPNLFGVFRSAAGQGGYAYSSALKESGLTWDEATLHKWLENPRALVPGNRMSFPGIKDAAKRQEIIDYLKQQS